MIKELLPLTERKLNILLALYTHGPVHNKKIAEITGLDKQNVSLHMKKFAAAVSVELHKKYGKVREYRLKPLLNACLSALLEQYNLHLAHQN